MPDTSDPKIERPPKDVIEFLNAWNHEILHDRWKSLSSVAVKDAEAEGASIEAAFAEEAKHGR